MVPALPPQGHWASLYPGCHWPLAYDNAPFLSSGNFSSGVRQGPVIDSHLSGPCPRGPCGAGGLLDLPLVPMPVSRAACAASAGRAGGSCFFLILSPSSQATPIPIPALFAASHTTSKPPQLRPLTEGELGTWVLAGEIKQEGVIRIRKKPTIIQ